MLAAVWMALTIAAVTSVVLAAPLRSTPRIDTSETLLTVVGVSAVGSDWPLAELKNWICTTGLVADGVPELIWK